MTSNTPQSKGLLTVMDFPLQSPDLKPTEYLWGHLTTEKDELSVASEEALWNTVKSCWDNTGHQVLHKLVESMPAPVHAAIKAKVGHSKYQDILIFVYIFFKDSTFQIKLLS